MELDYESKKKEAERIGLEVVPMLFSGMMGSLEQFFPTLESVSVLGGAKVKGLVVKAVDRTLPTVRLTTDAVAEKNPQEKKELIPTNITPRHPLPNSEAQITTAVRTVAWGFASELRFDKAYETLKAAGKITDQLADIGPLIGEVYKNITSDDEYGMMEELWRLCRGKVYGQLITTLPDWYKRKLLKG